MSNDERAAFEAWAAKRDHSGDMLWRDAHFPESYHYGSTQAGWEAWQARAAIAQQPAKRDDGMPASADERHLRRLLLRLADMLHPYTDDGEAQAEQHGITIDFMREPVADIDAKLRALTVARHECRAGTAIAQPAEPAEPDDDDSPAGCRSWADDCKLNGCRGDCVPQADAQPVASAVLYSPIATRPQIDGKHPNDNEARDPARSEYLRLRGDGEGQGLCDYWKWGHAAGWNDHKRHAAAPPARQPLSAEQIDRLWRHTFSTGNPFCPVDLKSFTKAVRATEAAHANGYGIGEGE